jgi:predicted AAA+ superfamily ATPase
LILAGVRQCGKTWALREFGKNFYKNTASFDFYENPEYHQFFQTTKAPHRIIQNLAMESGQIIKPGETLIIFDEIQECSEAIGTLKYFCIQCRFRNF